MKIIKLETYRQPSGVEITLRKVKMDWVAWTNLCVERLIGGQVQEGWYGWEENTLQDVYKGWVRFEHRIGSIMA